MFNVGSRDFYTIAHLKCAISITSVGFSWGKISFRLSVFVFPATVVANLFRIFHDFQNVEKCVKSE